MALPNQSDPKDPKEPKRYPHYQSDPKEKKRYSNDLEYDDDEITQIIPQEVIDQALQGNEAEDYGGFEAEDTQIIHIDELKARQRLRVKEALRQRRNSESKEYNEVEVDRDLGRTT